VSGYLERIVSNVLNPVGSGAIHPVLGSIYSRTTPEKMEGPRFGQDSASCPQEVKPSGVAPPFAPVAHAEVRQEISGVVPFARHRLMPEKQASLDPTTVSPPRASVTDRRLQEATESSGRAEAINTVEAILPERETEIIDRAYKPLVAGDFQRPSQQEVLRDRLSPALDGDRKVSPPRDPEREEIQIHIGRIEVTAVPQAPARLTDRPARKSLNLDEYLKRGDGRVL